MLARNWGIALVAVALTATSGLAGEYRNPTYHFSLTVPDEWDEMPRGEIDEVNAEASRRAPRGQVIRYETGFRHRMADANGLPYLLIQVLPNSIKGASYEDLEKALERELGAPLKEAQGAFADLAKDLRVGSAVIDRSKNRLVLRVQADMVGAGRVQILSVGHFGADRVVMVHAYARESDFAKWLPAFEQINEQFQFDSGNSFTPGSGRSFWGRVMNGAGSGAIIGAAAGLLVGLVAIFKRKRKPTPRFRQKEDIG